MAQFVASVPEKMEVNMDNIRLEGGDDDLSSSRSSNGEVDMENEPTLNPLEIFAELVWENVMDKFENPADLWNLLEAFPELHFIPNPTEILFVKVLPLFFNELQKEDVLACRGVCKWWKKSTDSFLENHPSHRPYDPQTFSQVITSYRYASLGCQRMTPTILPGPQVFRQIREDNERLHSPSSSFVGRCVQIGKFHRGGLNGGHDGIIPTNFFQELDSLLTMNDLGTNIWYVNLVLTGGRYDENYQDVGYMEMLIGCLEKLPNLKTLAIGNDKMTFRGIFTQEWKLFQKISWKHGKMVGKFILPELRQLESLELTGHLRLVYTRDWESVDSKRACIPIEDLFRMLIIKYSTQLRKLTMSYEFWREEYGSCLGNLTELNLNLQRDSHWPSSLSLRDILNQLQAPRLEKLGILIDVWPVSLKDILVAVKNHGTLKVLCIQTFLINRISDLRVAAESKLLPQVPNVTALRIQSTSHDERIPALALLKCFPNLEYLEIRNEKKMRIGEDWRAIWTDEEGDDWKLLRNKNILDYRGQASPKRVSIWKLFPKLKMFVFNGKSYARVFYDFN